MMHEKQILFNKIFRAMTQLFVFASFAITEKLTDGEYKKRLKVCRSLTESKD